MMSNVASMPKVQEILKDLVFPVGKQSIVDKAQQHQADERIVSMLQKLPDKQYNNSSEITDEMSKIQQ
jgi:hypothetical protein